MARRAAGAAGAGESFLGRRIRGNVRNEHSHIHTKKKKKKEKRKGADEGLNDLDGRIWF